MARKKTITTNYIVQNVEQAKKIAMVYLKSVSLDKALDFGLPEIDDRYHIWRVPLKNQGHLIGEVVIDSITSLIIEAKTTKKQVLEDRILLIRTSFL